MSSDFSSTRVLLIGKILGRKALLSFLLFTVTQFQVSETGGNRMLVCSLLIRAVPNKITRIYSLVKEQADTVNTSISIIIIQNQVRQEKVRA